MIAVTPSPPYYAVIFTSVRTEKDMDYEKTARRMMELAVEQEGFLGVESSREEVGITISYWRDLESIKKWKANSEHKIAQEMGRQHYYACYKTRICLVERDYMFENNGV